MENKSMKKGLSKEQYSFLLILAGLTLVALVAVVSLLRQRWVNPNRNQVTVYGEGKIEVQPDTARIVLGVKVDKAISAQEALNQLNGKMKEIIKAVSEVGVAENNIKTETYRLNPYYDYTDGSRKVVGYNAQEKIIIKVNDVDKNKQQVNKIVAAAGKANSNEIEGVSYYVENPSNLRQQALIMAIKDARKKAQALAQAAGIKKLTTVISWQESNQPTNYPKIYSDKAQRSSLSANEVSPQISAGTQEIKVGVGVNFAVN